MQSPSDEGVSPKTAERPEETTGGEGGSETPDGGRNKARRGGPSSDAAPLSPSTEPTTTFRDPQETTPQPLPDVPPETSFSDEPVSKREDLTFHPDRGLTRVELKHDDPPSVAPARTESRRGVNRVELETTDIDLAARPEPNPKRGMTKVEFHDPDFLSFTRKNREAAPEEDLPREEPEKVRAPPHDAPSELPGRGLNRMEVVEPPLRPPEPPPPVRRGVEANRVEIPHEIDSLLGIKDEERSSEASVRDRPFLAPPTRMAEQQPVQRPPPPESKRIPEHTPAPPNVPPTSFHRPNLPPRPGPQAPPPRQPVSETRNGGHQPPRPGQEPPRGTPTPPPAQSRSAMQPPRPEPAPTAAPPSTPPSPPVARAPQATSTSAVSPAEPKPEPPRSVAGLDAISDGRRSPTVATPVSAVSTVAEPVLDEKTAKIVGNRSRKWLAWFLGKPAHVEGVVTPVPSLEPHATQITLREMVPATAYARVLFHSDRGRHHYVVIEPPLDDRETRSLQFIKEVLLRTLDIELEIVERSVAVESLELLDTQVKKVVRDYRMDLSETSLRRLSYYLRRDFTGYGPVDVMMHDPDIEDISCDGPGTNVFLYHRRYGSMESNVLFRSAEELDGFVIRMAQRSGKQITIADPLLDSSLPDGSRLQATLGREVTDNGSTFTIRRFRDNPLSPIDLVRMGTMNADLLAYCWLVVQFGANVMLAGGTASGKTTTLNTISLFIPRQAKIVSIEDTREINLPHKNWVRSVTRGGSRGNDLKRVDMFDLLTAALRQRPEYILVGEVRGKEATVAFQAMATGHTVLGTIHADSPRSVVYRLESEPINIPRIVIQSLDVILMQALLTVGGRRQRRIQEVAEIVGIDPASKELLTHGVFLRNPNNDQLHYTGRSYKLQRIAQRNNWTPKQLETEMKRRAQIINALVALPDVTFDEIGRLFSMYENRPDAVESELERLRNRSKPEGTQ